MLMKKIKECCESNEVVILDFYKGSESVSAFGYIDCYNEDEILIKRVNLNGQNDGYDVIDISDVQRIRCGGKANKSMERLYELRHQSHMDIEYKDISLMGNCCVLHNIQCAERTEVENITSKVSRRYRVSANTAFFKRRRVNEDNEILL